MRQSIDKNTDVTGVEVKESHSSTKMITRSISRFFGKKSQN